MVYILGVLLKEGWLAKVSTLIFYIDEKDYLMVFIECLPTNLRHRSTYCPTPACPFPNTRHGAYRRPRTLPNNPNSHIPNITFNRSTNTNSPTGKTRIQTSANYPSGPATFKATAKWREAGPVEEFED